MSERELITLTDPFLGRCCICEIEGPEVRNIVMLDVSSPEPGNGCWGCLVCGLPQAGAVAVLCDVCVRMDPNLNLKRLKFACLGYPGENRRIEMALLKSRPPLEHDPAKHVAEAPPVDVMWTEL